MSDLPKTSGTSAVVRGDAPAPPVEGPVAIFRLPRSQRIFAVAGDPEPEYLGDYSEPASGLFVWSYVVRFANLGARPVQLVGRKWMIRDANDRGQFVIAASVGGERPWLEPGDTYTYSSGVPLPTHRGSMTGAFGFRTEEGDPIVVETARFDLKGPRPRRSRPAAKAELRDRDARVFRDALESYSQAVSADRDAELRIMRVRGVSDEGRRAIIRYLLFVFPFNETKATSIDFQELNINLVAVEVYDIFILYDHDIDEIDIVMKYWRSSPDMVFLEKHIILGSMSKPLSGPDLTGVRLRAALEELQKIDLDDPALSVVERTRIARRISATYYKLKETPEGAEMERNEQIRAADRIVKAVHRRIKKEKLKPPSP